MDIRHAMNPNVPLSQDDEERLAEFVNSPTYESLKRLHQFFRWEEINVGMVNATTPFQIGECQGSVGMLNKVEGYIERMKEDMNEANKTKVIKEESTKAWDDAFKKVEEQDEEVDTTGELI